MRQTAISVVSVVSVSLLAAPALTVDLKEIKQSGLLRAVVAAHEQPAAFSATADGPPGLERELLEGKRSSTGLSVPARRLRLPIHREARVQSLPLISGHVGADTAACLLAIDLASEERLVALMDVGTNTELILGSRDRILAASCPAGPAFEGGAISCGMPALDGAIEGIRLGDDGRVDLRVIGEGISLDLPEFLYFLRPATELDIPVEGTAQATFKMIDPLSEFS